MIRTLDHERDAEACDAIVAGLPGWFGLDEGIRQAARAVRSHEGLVAHEDEDVVGFLTWEMPRPASAEITWRAVRADVRRRRHGRALLEELARLLDSRGVRLLSVKTLSDRARSEEYEATRAFYEAHGFLATLDLDLWGPENPALLYVRVLG